MRFKCCVWGKVDFESFIEFILRKILIKFIENYEKKKVNKNNIYEFDENSSANFTAIC